MFRPWKAGPESDVARHCQVPIPNVIDGLEASRRGAVARNPPAFLIVPPGKPRSRRQVGSDILGPSLHHLWTILGQSLGHPWTLPSRLAGAQPNSRPEHHLRRVCLSAMLLSAKAAAIIHPI